jgi:hypothetical protein
MLINHHHLIKFYENPHLCTVIFAIADFRPPSSLTMNAPDRFELFILPDGVKKYTRLFESINI